MPEPVRLTHIGGPTLLVEAHGWRLLVDPTFDPPGRRYGFGWGTSSTKTAGPAVELADLPEIDAVLLSHDRHGDNLDAAGRALLPRVPAVVTTVGAARRLALPGAVGLRAGRSTTLTKPGAPPLAVLATPARHGPPLSRGIVGDVIGFALTWPGVDARVWISGDTVPHRRLSRALAGLSVDVAVLHLGAVRFPLTGPIRYSMTSTEAVALARSLRPRVAVPVHFEGWSHFSEPEGDMRRRLAGSGVPVVLLEPGRARDV